MCEVSWGESADVWTPEWRRARKEHRCEACGGRIRPGQRYVRLFTLYQGMKDSTKSCAHCWRAAEKFAKAHENFHPHPTGLAEDLERCVEEEPAEAAPWRRLLRGMSKRRELAGVAHG